MALAALGFPADALAAGGIKLSQPRPFSFERLVTEAKALAGRPYVADTSLPADVLQRIDYDAHGKIKYNPDLAVFRDGPGPFPVTFFHLGRYFQMPVHMYVTSRPPAAMASRARSSTTRAISHARRQPRAPAARARLRRLPAAGEPPATRKLAWQTNDWVAFLGASYFRAIGELYQYGLSARGIAARRGHARPARGVPDFTRFYFEPPARRCQHDVGLRAARRPEHHRRLQVRDAAGQGGADGHRGAPVPAPRRRPPRPGAADLDVLVRRDGQPTAIDWRPEVHDSDGLAIWNGAGERIWRPLNNPTRTAPRPSATTRPRGFGLLQRDRNSTTTRTAWSTRTGPASGSSRWATGARARCSWSRSPPTTRSTTTSSPTGCPRRRPGPAQLSISTTACTGPTRSPFPPPLARWLRPAWAAAASRARRGRRACASSWSSSSASRSKPPLRRQARAGAHGLARQVLVHLRGGGAQRRAGPLARAVRLHGRRHGAGRHAAVS